MESMDTSLDHFCDEVMNANYLIPNDARIREFWDDLTISYTGSECEVMLEPLWRALGLLP